VDQEAQRQRYRSALESFLTKARQDPYIVGVVLSGSLSYDTVWERSDIDLMVITQDVKIRVKSHTLVEDQINIHAGIMTRSEFKRMIGGALGGSFLHSYLAHGTLVYSCDTTLDEIFAERCHLGIRDQQIGLMRAATNLIGSLDKAQKWLVTKNDADYSLIWTLRCLDAFATLVLIRAGEIPNREAILHAARLQPDRIDPLYHDLIHGPKDAAAITRAITAMESYLTDGAQEICAPLFEFLTEAQTVQSSTAVEEHFEHNFGLSAVSALCEWLADRGLLHKVASPVRVTEKSKVAFDEAAFYYSP